MMRPEKTGFPATKLVTLHSRATTAIATPGAFLTLCQYLNTSEYNERKKSVKRCLKDHVLLSREHPKKSQSFNHICVISTKRRTRGNNNFRSPVGVVHEVSGLEGRVQARQVREHFSLGRDVGPADRGLPAFHGRP